MNINRVWVCMFRVTTEPWRRPLNDPSIMPTHHTCLLTHLQHCLVMQQEHTHTHTHTTHTHTTWKSMRGANHTKKEKVNPLPLRNSHTLKALEGCVSDPACQLLFIIHQADQRTPSRNSEDPDKRQSVLTIDRSSLIPHWQGIGVTGSKETHMHSLSLSHTHTHTHTHTHFETAKPKVCADSKYTEFS